MLGSRAASARFKKVMLAFGAIGSAAALAACGSSSSSTTSSASSATGTTTSGAAASTSTTTHAATGSPITVAVISFKIPGIDELTPIDAGGQAAANLINSEGGFGGHPLKLVTCNSMLAPAPATTCARNTIGLHPLAMVGCELSWSISGLPIYAAAKTPSLNCPNTTVDFHSPWSFGMNPGEAGDNAATLAYACSLPKVKTIVSMITNVPAAQEVFNQETAPIVKACGKTAYPIFVSPTVVDITPYVQKAMGYHPQFILGDIQTAQVPQMFSLFEQNGIAAGDITASDVAFTASILAKSPQMKGGISIAEFNPWTMTNLPDVAAYVKGMQGTGVDYKDPSVEWGWALITWVYDASKAVGFSNLNGATLAAYLRTAANQPIPLSREWVNPGPTNAPQVKQPYARMLIWNGSTFTPVSGGDQGWFTGLK